MTQNRLTLGNSPELNEETDQAILETISWAVQMTPQPTVEKVFKVCSGSEELSNMDAHAVRAAIQRAITKENSKL